MWTVIVLWQIGFYKQVNSELFPEGAIDVRKPFQILGASKAKLFPKHWRYVIPFVFVIVSLLACTGKKVLQI